MFPILFNCKWPAKSLQELFQSGVVVPDPEFKSFDLGVLGTHDGPGSNSQPKRTIATQSGSPGSEP